MPRSMFGILAGLVRNFFFLFSLILYVSDFKEYLRPHVLFIICLRWLSAKWKRRARGPRVEEPLAAQLDSPRARMPSLRQVDRSGSPLPLTCEASFLHRLSSRYFSSFTCHFLMVNAREIPLFRVIGATRPLVFSFDGSMWIFRFRLVIICLWVR